MHIEELFEGINLEDEYVEFKGIIKEGENPNNKNERLEFGWLKEIVGFANSLGGTLYIGVDNKTHEILALDHKTADKIVLMIHRNIKEHVEPPIKYHISKIDIKSEEDKETRYVIKVIVEKSKVTPISLKFNGLGFIFIRHFGKTSIATREEIRDLVLNSEDIAFDEPFIDIEFKERDFKQLFDYYYKVNNKKLTKKDLISINFISLDNKLSKGALLFKDDYNEDKTLVECTQFLGFSKGDDVFYATKTIKGNLLKEFLEIKDFIVSRSANGFIKTDKGREELISFPLRALNEGIINALAHRNYFINGTQIEINLFKDRLEIISPGSLLGSRYLNKEKDLASIPPRRRNEVISSTFSLLKLMEKRGSGFDKIIEEYSKYDDKYAPFVSSSSTHFSLTLPDLSFKKGIIENDEAPGIYINEDIKGKHDLKILSYCYNKSRSVSEISKFLDISPSSYFRKEVIDRLVDEDYLIKIYEDKSYKYFTNKKKVYLKDNY